jgi:hypothetical protein
VKKSRYQFLSRKEREAVDFVTDDLMLGLLESGDVKTFNTIIGVLQDLKDIAGRVSTDQEKCLRLPIILFKAATKVPQVIVGNDNHDTVD